MVVLVLLCAATAVRVIIGVPWAMVTVLVEWREQRRGD